MAHRYKVSLTEEERTILTAGTRSGKTNAPKFIHARALLLCDTGPDGPSEPWKVSDVAEALGVSARTIEHLKQRFVEEGLEAALERKPRSDQRTLTFCGDFEARLTALACSPAPAGRTRWTVRLLAEKVVELQIAPKVSTMTIQRTLKKRIASSFKQILEDPPRRECCLCRLYGRRARTLSCAFRPQFSLGLYG